MIKLKGKIQLDRKIVLVALILLMILLYQITWSFHQKCQNPEPFFKLQHMNLNKFHVQPHPHYRVLVHAAEVTVELLKAEAKMWEQNTQKLMIDLETLQKKLFDQSNHQENFAVQLSALHTEREGMKQEIVQLKIFLDKERANQLASEDLVAKTMDKTRRELEHEIKFQEQSNANLSAQLTKSLEANIELVSVLQELEGTVEKQNNEIAKLSLAKSRFEEFKLQQWQESQKILESIIQSLQRPIDEKNHEIEKEKGFKIQILMESEAEWRGKLEKKEEEVINLKAKLFEALASNDSKAIERDNGDH